MNIIKNIEAISLVAAVLIGVTSYAAAEVQEIRAARQAQVSVEGQAKIAVVTIKAQRGSAI